MSFTIEQIDSSLEKRVLTGLIVSSDYSKEIVPILEKRYFQNAYICKVAGWCLVYFKHYGKAPFKDIQSIFNQQR